MLSRLAPMYRSQEQKGKRSTTSPLQRVASPRGECGGIRRDDNSGEADASMYAHA